jgi:hypothetical protein
MPDPSLADRDEYLRVQCAALANDFTWRYLTPYMREKAFAFLLGEATALRIAHEAAALQLPARPPDDVHESHVEGRA